MKNNKLPDFSKAKTYPIRERAHKVRLADFGDVSTPIKSLSDFLDSLPKILKAKELRELVEIIGNAIKRKKAFIIAIGGHVIKCGLGPYLIELMKRKILTAIACNGSAAIHDFELAMIGKTSEDVGETLETGMFGMVEETGRMMNEALIEGASQGIGAGQAFGEMILKKAFPHKDISVLAQGVEYSIPVTVHISIGADTIHQHPKADGGAIGETSFRDFQRFAAILPQLNDGGVLINIGSAVMMPEVFLKALALARNVCGKIKNFTTANFDMIQHYRPMANVLSRPTISGGKSYAFTGHHEIMIPLLVRLLLEKPV
jgi:hypothetical protein